MMWNRQNISDRDRRKEVAQVRQRTLELTRTIRDALDELEAVLHEEPAALEGSRDGAEEDAYGDRT